MLINGRQGVLSIGGTGAPAVDLVVKQTKDQLDQVGALERGETLLPPTVEDAAAISEGAPLAKRGRAHTRIIETREASWKDGWEWSTVQGAEGWWQILMQGVWVDGTKVLQNQAAVVDVCLGMILCQSEALSTNRTIDQLPVHPRASFGCESFLRLDLRLASAARALFEFLRFSLPQSSSYSVRDRYEHGQISSNAWQPRRGLVSRTGWTFQSG